MSTRGWRQEHSAGSSVAGIQSSSASPLTVSIWSASLPRSCDQQKAAFLSCVSTSVVVKAARVGLLDASSWRQKASLSRRLQYNSRDREHGAYEFSLRRSSCESEITSRRTDMLLPLRLVVRARCGIESECAFNTSTSTSTSQPILSKRLHLSNGTHRLQSIESAALRTGELSKEDKLQVKRRYGCSAVVLKKRFDVRGTSTPKRGKKAASIIELADRFELSALQRLGKEADGCDAADIAALCKEVRVFAVHRGQILAEIHLRHHDKHKRYFGRTTGLKEMLFKYVGGAQYTIFLSAYNFTLMELAIKLAEAKAKGVRVVVVGRGTFERQFFYFP